MKSMRILVILAVVTIVLSMSPILLEAKDDVTAENKSAKGTPPKEDFKENNLTESIYSKIGQLLICAIIVIVLVCGGLAMMVYVHFIKPKKSQSPDTGKEIKELHQHVKELKEEVKELRKFIEERFIEEIRRRER